MYFRKFVRVDVQKDCFVVVKKGVRLAIGNGPVSLFFDVADDFTASVFEAIENVFGYERLLRRIKSNVERCVGNGVWVGKTDKSGCPVDFWPVHLVGSHSARPATPNLDGKSVPTTAQWLVLATGPTASTTIATAKTPQSNSI